MNLNLICLTLAVYLSFALAEKTSYVGYRLYNVYPRTKEQIDLIGELEHNEDFDLWSREKGAVYGIKVALGPKAIEKYEKLFKLFKIEFEIVRTNLQEVIDDEERQMRMRRNLGESRNIVGRYARFSEIQSFIQDQVQENPTIARSYVAGRSYESRDLRIIQIGVNVGAASKRHIWIDCGIHAREWVSPSTCVYMIDAFISDYKRNDPDVVAFLTTYDIHILPLVNPDGYEFSHVNTRLWRKNRRINSGSPCIGVDLNRNNAYQWLTGGSSTLPCSDTYAGPSAASEPETQAVMSAINAQLGKWDAFLTIHSYGKWWFTTYGYTTILPPDFVELNTTAAIGIKAISDTYNESGWTCGSSAQMLYIASGGSEDWAYGVAGIKHSYCLELRPGNSGPDSNYGFQLPEDRAPLAGRETYNGVKAFINAIKTKA